MRIPTANRIDPEETVEVVCFAILEIAAKSHGHGWHVDARVFRHYDGRRFPRVLAGWADRERRLVVPVEAHDQVGGAVLCGQLVGFFGLDAFPD